MRLRSVTSSSPVVSTLNTPATNVLRTLTDHAHTRYRCMAYAFISGANPPHTIFLRFNTTHTPGTDLTRPQSSRLQTRHEPAVGPFRPSTNVKRAHSHPPHTTIGPETSGNKPASNLNRTLSDEIRRFCLSLMQNNQIQIVRMELDIESIMDSLIEDVKSINPEYHFNERYLHHLFSHKVQEKGPVISFKDKSVLHPEWATSIQDLRQGGCYSYDKEKRQYIITDDPHGAGFIDFAIGDESYPDYAVEFKMSKQLNKEGVVFDMMKLIDNRNRIKKKVFSVTIYYGHSSFSNNMKKNNLEKCLSEAMKRLSINQISRDYRFVFVEITNNHRINIIELINSNCVNSK